MYNQVMEPGLAVQSADSASSHSLHTSASSLGQPAVGRSGARPHATAVQGNSCHSPGDSSYSSGSKSLQEPTQDPLPAYIFDPEPPAVADSSSGADIESGDQYWHQVILRVELATSAEIKASQALLFATSLVAFLAQFVLLANKILQPNEQTWFSTNYLERTNVIVASVCMAMLLLVLAAFAVNLLRADKTKHWCRRKRRLSLLALSKVVIQLGGLSAYLAINIHVATSLCAWTDEFVSWGLFVRGTCLSLLYLIFLVEARNTNPWLPSKRRAWLRRRLHKPNLLGGLEPGPVLNTGRAGTAGVRLVLDGPWKLHWFAFTYILVYYLFICGVQIYTAFEYQQARRNDRLAAKQAKELGEVQPDCRTVHYDCGVAKGQTTWLLVDQAVTFSLFLLYCRYMYIGFRHLWLHPYSAHKLSNVATRLQLRQTLPIFLITQICIVLSWYVMPYSCASLIMTVMGSIPQELLLSTLVAVSAFYFMPKRPNKSHPFPLDWLQEFACVALADSNAAAEPGDRVTTCSAGRSMHQPTLNRTSTLTRLSSPVFWRRPTLRRALAAEPLFCVETAIKAAFWSHMVYNYPPVKPLIVEEMPHAMGIWDFSAVEEVVEPSVDSKALLAWNKHRLLVVFRGTASMANALTNIRAWRTAHPPKRGWYCLCRQPLVHSGFLHAWRAGGFHTRVLMRIRSLLDSGEVDAGSCRVVVTGHSLGGAMATLAAYDVQKEFGFSDLSCYTYGAPRTGNHSFAKDLKTVIPDTWHIINDQDAIPRTGKLVCLYKMPGHRVIINLKGDLVVRPSMLEATLRMRFGGGKLADHMYKSYQRAFVAILASQWGDKYQHGGRTGVQQMLTNPHMLYVLQQVGFGRLVDQARRVGHVQPLGRKSRSHLLQEQAASAHDDLAWKLAEGVTKVTGAFVPVAPRVLEDGEKYSADAQGGDGGQPAPCGVAASESEHVS
ncbi:hypothetical protein WJX72_007213 [[Myrmecia] bisecta]|uniref:Fungal lipase-type domain-containing protein n=1 Tax=[Myrmecia] bisecta TaxID=41462 RepID=A0AAW1R7D9_9CHLO